MHHTKWTLLILIIRDTCLLMGRGLSVYIARRPILKIRLLRVDAVLFLPCHLGHC